MRTSLTTRKQLSLSRCARARKMNFGVIAGYRIKYRSIPVPNRYRSPYSGTRLVKASESLFIPVPECLGAVCRAVKHLAFKNFQKVERDSPCTSPYMAAAGFMYDVEKS